MDPLSPRPPQSPSIWPPPTNAPFGQEESVNTSGEKGDVPPEIARLRWNWGAFLLPFLWCISHRLVVWGWGILALTSGLIFGGRLDGFLGLAYFGVAVYLGLMGQSLGWQNRRFDGGEAQYFAVQRKWIVWGAIASVLSVAAIWAGLAGLALR